MELVEVPKVLGDLLESLLGAVFLDSGHDLAVVWEVFRYLKHPPPHVTLYDRKLCPDLDSIVKNPPFTNYKR